MTFILASAMKGSSCKKQNMKVSKLNNRKAFNKIKSDQGGCAYLDNGSATFEVGGDAWITEIITDRKIDISGYDDEDITKTDAPMGSTVTSVVLPDNETSIICANGATPLGESANSLYSEVQTEEMEFMHIKQIMNENIWMLTDILYLLILSQI